MIQGAHVLSKDCCNYIVITKSMKDVMCLYEFGIPAIAPNSENLFLTEAQYNRIRKKYNKCIVLYDNDLAGVSNMNKIRKQYSEISVAFIPRKYGAKDISDFRALYGKKRTIELLENAKNYYLDEKEELKLLRLLGMRVWNLKKKVAKFQEKERKTETKKTLKKDDQELVIIDK